jgi:hypothetical protein
MQSGWYIVNYHDVDYEDSILTMALGGTTRPDVFRMQVNALSRIGQFISIDEGQQRLDSGRGFDEPVFSLWFDDGYSGLPENAVPVCEQHGIAPALSICSRFALRREMFWRAKLSYLARVDGLARLRARLQQQHSDVSERLRSWTLHNFSSLILEAVDDVYRLFSSDAFRQDAFRIFLTPEQLQDLTDRGWLITNHSAAHYPLASGLGWDAVRNQFDECEEFVRHFNPRNPYWVVPFGFGSEHYVRQLGETATIVEVGERRNTVASWRESRRLYRHSAPSTPDILSSLR